MAPNLYCIIFLAIGQVVELLILADQEDELVRRDAFRNMSLPALLEPIGTDRQGHVLTARETINRDAGNHYTPIIAGVDVHLADKSGRHLDDGAVRTLREITVGSGGAQFTVHTVRYPG